MLQALHPCRAWDVQHETPAAGEIAGLTGHACAGSRVVHGYSVFGDNSTEDCYGHGTHVSGIVGGLTFGVAKNATIYAGECHMPCPATVFLKPQLA
jgi:hypothetical protein